MMMSSEIGELAKALAAAQSQLRPAKKDNENPFFKSRYADLTAIWEACREPLSKNQLSVSQIVMERDDGKSYLRTMLLHSSGQWLFSDYRIMPVKSDPQGVGSAITYARRYALSAIVGIATEDDDGNSASGRTDKPEKRNFDDLPARKSKPVEKSALKEMDNEPPSKLLKLPDDIPLYFTGLSRFLGVPFSKYSDSDITFVGQQISQIGNKPVPEGVASDKIELRKRWYGAIANALIAEVDRRG